MEHKRVKIKECPTVLQFVRAVKDATGKSLLESKNIADSIRKFDSNGVYSHLEGIILLNESSISPEQWEEIAANTPGLKWEYV